MIGQTQEKYVLESNKFRSSNVVYAEKGNVYLPEEKHTR